VSGANLRGFAPQIKVAAVASVGDLIGSGFEHHIPPHKSGIKQFYS